MRSPHNAVQLTKPVSLALSLGLAVRAFVPTHRIENGS